VAARRRDISETELEILKVLWEHGPGTVREIDSQLRKAGRRWAYTTVLTLLSRLQAKGYVKSDKTELAHVFKPAVTRDRLMRRRLKDLADALCDGAATPLVLALVEGERFSALELEQFRRLLDELDAKRSK